MSKNYSKILEVGKMSDHFSLGEAVIGECCDSFPVCCETFPTCCETFPDCCESFPECCENFPVCCETFPKTPFAVK